MDTEPSAEFSGIQLNSTTLCTIYMGSFHRKFPENFSWKLPRTTLTATENTRVNMNQSRLGLQQKLTEDAPDGTKRVRVMPKTEPKRDEGMWQHVKVLREHATSPQVQCNYCMAVFVGGATRIRDHLCDKCTCGTNAFMSLKEKLLEERAETTSKKAKKAAEAEVDHAVYEAEVSVKSEVKIEGGGKGKGGQMSIQSSLNSSSKIEVDAAIAEFFYGCNIPPAVANHPLFKKMVGKLKTAPASYAAPDAKRLGNDLLESTTSRLRTEEAPVREAVLKDGGTVVSDGWDDIAKNHLINFLCGNSKGFFFDGTLKLTSEDSENAEKIAELISCFEPGAEGHGQNPGRAEHHS